MAKEKITQAQLSELLGCSQQWIAKLKSKGALTRWDNLGALLVEGWKHSAAEASGRMSDNSELDLVAERARLAARQSDKLDLELAKMRGELIPEDIIAEYFNSFAVAIRAKLLALPSRYRSQFPALTPRQVDALDSAVREILEELSLDRFPTEYREKIGQRMAELHTTAKTDSGPVGGPAPVSQPRGQRRAGKVADRSHPLHARRVSKNHQP